MKIFLPDLYYVFCNKYKSPSIQTAREFEKLRGKEENNSEKLFGEPNFNFCHNFNIANLSQSY